MGVKNWNDSCTMGSMRIEYARNCHGCGKEFWGTGKGMCLCKDCKKRKSVRQKNIVEKVEKPIKEKSIKPPKKKPCSPKSKIQRYNDYVKGAVNREYAFHLSIEEFEEHWQKPCYYCGAEIKTIGLDRVDNHRGYFANNVVSCCTVCNLMKRSTPFYEFIKKCDDIAKRHQDKLENI